MSAEKQISIILPSFRDERIVQAIASVRAFDDLGTVRIVVIDGGSARDLVEKIEAVLSKDDVLVSERDRGIFDGLNKGLERVTTPYLGWLGSDDLFTGAVKASDVVAALQDHDLFVASLFITSGPRVVRKTHSWGAGHGFVHWGLHNPHYSTFGRTSLLASERFALDDVSADIPYFLRIFDRQPKVAVSRKIGLLQAAGGFSTAGPGKSIEINKSIYRSYARRSNRLAAFVAISLKLSYRVASVAYYKLFPARWPRLFPDLARLIGAAPGAEA
jgi:glycosyltransferase